MNSELVGCGGDGTGSFERARVRHRGWQVHSRDACRHPSTAGIGGPHHRANATPPHQASVVLLITVPTSPLTATAELLLQPLAAALLVAKPTLSHRHRSSRRPSVVFVEPSLPSCPSCSAYRERGEREDKE